MEETKDIHGFKGFDRDMKCRGFQFEEGKAYKHEGNVKACSSGFHFCENPLDVFSYYPPGESVFRAVRGGGDESRDSGDSKVAVSELTIGAELQLPDFIGAAVKFMFSRKYEESTSSHAELDRSASSATGDSSASSATGDSSASSATGDRSASSATGDSSAAVCTGSSSKAMAGKYGCIALAWWNEKKERVEMRCSETGCGDGSDGKLKSDTWYVLDDFGSFVEAK